jgi:hypothetical protein
MSSEDQQDIARRELAGTLECRFCEQAFLPAGTILKNQKNRFYKKIVLIQK